jgi:hypothetical protein
MIGGNTITYKHQQPIFNGNKFVEVGGAGCIASENHNTGVISFRLKTSGTGTEQIIFTSTKESGASNECFVSTQNNSTSSCLYFKHYAQSGSKLRFYINSLSKDFLADGKFHYCSIPIDGLNNRMIIDSVTYENSDLTFLEGSKTTSLFMLTSISAINLGRLYRWGDSSDILYFKGLISELKITNVADTTTYYSCSISDTNLDATHLTYINKNESLNLGIVNGAYDLSENNETITENGTAAIDYVPNKYGIENTAIEFDGVDQNASFSAVTIDKDAGAFYIRFKLLSWVSGNYGNNNVLLSNNSTGFRYLGVASSGRLYGETNTNGEFYVSVLDAISLNKWYDLFCVFSTSTCYTYLNGKLIDEQILYNNLTLSELNGVVDGLLNKTFSNSVIDKFTVYNYAMSAEDIKATYKAIPENNSIFAVTDQSTLSQVGFRCDFSSGRTIIHWGDGAFEEMTSGVELLHDYSKVGKYDIRVTNSVNLINIFADNCNLINVQFAKLLTIDLLYIYDNFTLGNFAIPKNLSILHIRSG